MTIMIFYPWIRDQWSWLTLTWSLNYPNDPFLWPLASWLVIMTISYVVIMSNLFVIVPDPGKGVCADPVNGDAILGEGAPDPQGGNKERQLSPDKGREKTWYVTGWEDDKKTRKTTPSWLQDASMQRVS